MFCNETCQKKSWGSHKKDCKQLKELFDTSNPAKLEPVRCQIIRTRDGAIIKNAERMVPSEITTLRSYDHTPSRELLALLLGTHNRLGEFSKVLKLKGYLPQQTERKQYLLGNNIQKLGYLLSSYDLKAHSIKSLKQPMHSGQKRIKLNGVPSKTQIKSLALSEKL
jgi:hypothetical protein